MYMITARRAAEAAANLQRMPAPCMRAFDSGALLEQMLVRRSERRYGRCDEECAQALLAGLHCSLHCVCDMRAGQ